MKEPIKDGFKTLRGFVAGQEPADFEPVFRYLARLRVFGDNGLDHDEIAKTLGVQPTTG